MKRQKVFFDFGVFRLDPEERVLLCASKPVPLTPRAFDTLLLLVENRGHVLRKEELIEKLWPDSFVGENSLAQNISALRKALDEGSGNQYIETVPRIGYRFTAEVSRSEAQSEALSSSVEPTVDATNRAELDQSLPVEVGPAYQTLPVTEPSHQKIILAALIFLALILTVAIGFWLKTRKAPAAPTGAPLRVAVLPFRNLKQDPETDFLSFSLADAIITKLRYVDTLIVRPSAYVDKYRNQVIDPAQVAGELKVDLLLTGTFIKEGEDLRITAQLVDVGRNQIVRQDAIDLKYDKLLTVQDRVTAQVISGLKLNLTPSERNNLELDTPASAKAYEYYLHGVDLYSQNNFAMAVNLLEKTVAIDPNYAAAWAHLGRAYNAEAAFAMEGTEAYDKAFAAYEKALNLNPQQIEPRIFMANTYTDTGRVWASIPLLRETLKAHPNLAEAHWELGYAYRFGGMLKESIEECERARQLDPEVKINNSAINSYLYSGKYDQFLKSLPQTESIAYIVFYRGFANLYLGDRVRAAADFDRAYQLEPSLYTEVGKAFSRIIAGQNAQAVEILRNLEQKIENRKVRDAEGIYKVAQAYAVMGDKASALRVLRKSIEGGFFCYPYFVSDPLLESLHGEPEYKTLMELARKHHEDFKREFFGQ
jgi:DNA-binding winged helix-turn-helix (wHTH) protein/TolB-like protein/Flp pilus assembly protein TadD